MVYDLTSSAEWDSGHADTKSIFDYDAIFGYVGSCSIFNSELPSDKDFSLSLAPFLNKKV